MARKSKKYHYIYKTTNLKNGTFYVGMHSTDDLNDGYLGSGTRLRRSIRRNGKHNYKLEILEFLPNRHSLIKREKKLINEEFIKHPMCLNLKPGGTGGFCNEKHRMSFLEASKKTQICNLNKGRETQKILWKTNKNWASHKREILSKISKGNKSFSGRQHSEETKSKMSEKASKRIGEKNSQYGTCWITNNLNNKKIKKIEPIPEGWKRGRI